MFDFRPLLLFIWVCAIQNSHNTLPKYVMTICNALLFYSVFNSLLNQVHYVRIGLKIIGLIFSKWDTDSYSDSYSLFQVFSLSNLSRLPKRSHLHNKAFNMATKQNSCLTSLSLRGPVNLLTPIFSSISLTETDKFNYCLEIQSKLVARISIFSLNP